MSSFTPETFNNLQFDVDERSFFEMLSKQQILADNIIHLFQITDLFSVPLSAPDLSQKIVENLVTTAVGVKIPSWSDAIRSLNTVVALKASEDVQFFINGKFPPLAGKKPQAKNIAFFIKLASYYSNV